MPRKGENIYKRKDGRWEGRYIKNYRDGRAVYGSVYSTSYKEVRKKLVAIKGDLNRPGYDEINQDASQFSAIAIRWFNVVGRTLKESSQIKYENILNLYLLPHFQQELICNITSSNVENFCAKLLTSGGVCHSGLSPKTVKDILSVLNNIIAYARKQGLVVSYVPKDVVVRQKYSEIVVLSHEDHNVLCDYLLSDLTEKNLGIILCLFTGMRVGELCALRWEDISFCEHTIHIHSTLQRLQDRSGAPQKTKIVITTPKSQCSIRTIPLPNSIESIICSKYPLRNGYVLTGSENKYVEPRSMEYHLNRIMKQLSLPPTKFHALRHTFATRCIEAGVDAKTLSEILGHANVNITLNRYVHPTMDVKRRELQKLANLYAVK